MTPLLLSICYKYRTDFAPVDEIPRLAALETDVSRESFRVREIANSRHAAATGCCAAKNIEPLMFHWILFFHCLVVVNESAILQLTGCL